MKEKSHPLEKAQPEFKNSKVENYLKKLKKFSKSFLQRGTGLVGILFLFIVITVGISGNRIKNPPSSLYSGKQAQPKAPLWASIWGQKPVHDQRLVSHKFESTSSCTAVKNFKIKRKVNTGEHFIDAQCGIQKHHLSFNFSGVYRNQNYNSTKSIASALIVASSSFQWEYDIPPNGYDFLFKYRTLVSSINKSRQSNSYDWSFTPYIKSRRVNNMKLFLEDVSGINIPKGIHKKSYGIQLSSPVPKMNSTHWETWKGSLSRRIWVKIFETCSKLEINYVANFKWKKPSSKPHFQPKISIQLDNIELIAKGYYGGIFGTSPTGHNLYGLIAVGVKNSLLLGGVTSLVMLSLGVTLGLVSGFYRGKIDEVTMRIADILLSVPNLPIMMVMTMVFSRGGISRIWGIVIVVAFMSWARTARFIRSQVLVEREKPYIETAKASGVPSFHIIFKHLLPNIIGVLLYQIIISLQRVIFITAGLSFLGLGPANWLSLGKIMQNSIVIQKKDIQAFHFWLDSFFPGWWFAFFPGFILVLLLLGLLLIGMAFQDIYQFSSYDY